MVAPELFWPLDPPANYRPSWPRLTSVIIDYVNYTASGRYLFDPDPEWYELDPTWGRRDAPRIKPVHGLLNDLYRAAGRAAQYMPKLELMLLESDIWNQPDTVDEYGERKSPGHLFIYRRDRAYVLWASSSEFEIDPNVREVWEEVARKHGIPQCLILNQRQDQVSVHPNYFDGAGIAGAG
ncbi:uncharacterized protein DSM5745_00336 [Aspergillus mulundensis]|uniref:DUF6546 domain-containing protein n=1 Tax=Aspergillus mulundensis TaxID=1810919 RepID=A0A3D8T386_9EURO|nr:hypothetical protein DSM5745_00336 [Aspergillus mulundensis]RDW93014.1 hypothetical protein DSM5745_00336 [Aspergillus mulundensis]